MGNKAEKFVKAAYEASKWKRHDDKMIDVINAVYNKFGRGKKTPPEYQRAMNALEDANP